MPAELGGTGVSQAHSLQPAREGRALCGVGTTGAVRRGDAGGVQDAPGVRRGARGAEKSGWLLKHGVSVGGERVSSPDSDGQKAWGFWKGVAMSVKSVAGRFM